MRTGSNFERPFLSESDLQNLFYDNQGGFGPSVENIYLAGVKVVEGILNGWDSTFEKGIKPKNYIGDILGTLPQQYKPDFGLPASFLPQATTNFRKRDMYRSRRMRGRSVVSVHAG